MYNNLFTRAHQCLFQTEVNTKLKCVKNLVKDWRSEKLGYNAGINISTKRGVPKKPELVALGKLKPRKLDTTEGHAAMIHSIAHIEFSADCKLNPGNFLEKFPDCCNKIGPYHFIYTEYLTDSI